MSREFLFDIHPSSCYKTQTNYGFAHPERLRDRPYDASATGLDGANFGGQFVREMRDGMRLAYRLSFERLFILFLFGGLNIYLLDGQTLEKVHPTIEPG
jgi:hypothetical protein